MKLRYWSTPANCISLFNWFSMLFCAQTRKRLSVIGRVSNRKITACQIFDSYVDYSHGTERKRTDVPTLRL